MSGRGLAGMSGRGLAGMSGRGPAVSSIEKHFERNLNWFTGVLAHCVCACMRLCVCVCVCVCVIYYSFIEWKKQ